MDLVVLIDDPAAGLESSHLVQMMGDLLERVSLESASCYGRADCAGDEFRRQAVAKGSNPHPQAHSSTIASAAIR